MKGRKISTVVLFIVFALSMIFTLTACMSEDDYYNKGDIDSLVAELQSELLSKTNETNAAIAALKAEHEAEISAIEANVKANSNKITELTIEYNVKLAALEKADKDNADAIAALKSSYETELAKLKAADEENSAKITELTNAYNAKVEALEANLKTSTETLTGLIDELKDYDEKTSETLESIKSQIAEILASMEKQYHTVTFVTGEGSVAPEKQSIVDGKKATKPADPKKAGYIFDGWYIDGEKWSFIGYVVTEDIELVAVWLECTEHVDSDDNDICDKCAAAMPDYTVTFNTSGGTPVPNEQKIYVGKKVAEPEAPRKTGYIFNGWYLGDGKWNFAEDTVTDNITLTAKWSECNEHVVDENFYCTICGADTLEMVDVPWDNQTLIFQLSENDNNKELSSGCHRYLAGDDDINYTKAIDTSIDQRNTRAEIATKTDVIYLYWDNTRLYLRGQCIEQIEQIVNSKTAKNAPDVYVNFMYDMVGCAVKGYFANLKGTSRGTGNLAGLNYFEFNDADYDESVDNRGYMDEWMNSVTLSQHKMYVLGSDYFIDVMRAAMVIPVGIDLLEGYGMDITGDRNGDGKFTVDDFYEQIYAGEWTYDLLMDYSEAVWLDDGLGSTDKCWIGDEQVGFAISSSGFPASGLLYTTNVALIEKEWDMDTNDWRYYYPDDNVPLGELQKAIKEMLFGTTRVVYVKPSETGYDISEWGANDITAIRTRFSNGKVLFGDIVMLGWLEYEEYRSMGESYGFGVVPIPLYDKDAGFREGAPYLTQFNSTARPGAIAKNTTKFVECTAYLNYQSTHSTDILNKYYNDELMYNITGDAQGTVDMLKYIRQNVRTSFDNAMEDAMGVFSGAEAYNTKVLVMMATGNWQNGDIRGTYKENLGQKRGYLTDLIKWFESTSD